MDRQHINRKRKTKHSLPLDNANNTIFPLILSTLLTSPPKPKSLILKCLNKFHQSLLSNSHQPSILPMLSLFPTLLHSRWGGIARASAEILGAASLFSIQMNELICSDEETLKALILLLVSSKNRLLFAACNALLDICTTSFGRHTLLHFSAHHTLMFAFLKVSTPSTFSSCIKDETSVSCLQVLSKEDRIAISLLHAALTLIVSCDIKHLEKIPEKLSRAFLVLLKRLWEKEHNKLLLVNAASSSIEDCLCLSNIRMSDLAESVFRLSMNVDQYSVALPSVIERRMFNMTEPGFSTFILQHWEASPVLIRNSGSLIDEDDIFSSFAQSINCSKMDSTFLSPMLQSFISCLPIASDEIDILTFLEEMRNELGCPIVYQQDIRVLRTDKHLKRQVHFFRESSDKCCSKPSHSFSLADITKCEEAFKEGYTVAVRGMEFRIASIAATADALASLFGQPSVGANMYLTPPNSQGLACHYDDHCVFVCQLFGTKEWTIYSRPNLQLPRLYDALHTGQDPEFESSSAGSRKFFLTEGDILYIPRGFSHEACTNSGGSDDSAKFSLHLTFGVEVEPPFEWEGFSHVAVLYWSQTKITPHDTLNKSLPETMFVMSVKMLHAVVEIIGASDPTFRKACLVAGITLPLNKSDWLYLCQKNIFDNVIEKIDRSSGFFDILSRLERAIGKEDPFQRMRWLRVLFQEYNWDILGAIKNLLSLPIEHKHHAEAAFMHIKSKFCSEVLLEDVVHCYKMVLEKFKKPRKQYMNGMLSLQGN